MLTSDEVQQQSMNAWKQWRIQWIKNAKINKNLKTDSFSNLLGIGKGKKLLQIANGYSLALNLDEIKKHINDYDIYCCDKTFGYLIKNGIYPKYCHVADANVKFDEWGKGFDSSKTILISNIAAAPQWGLEWKGKKYYYTNWDNIGTAQVLGKAGNCFDVIPASSNVSNSQIVFSTQVIGYDKQLLVGFDYSWQDDGKYYATGNVDKQYYMNHASVNTIWGDIAFSSTNLIFSCRWLMSYISKFKKSVIINCSERGILNTFLSMSLKKGLVY